jgi:uncharacterized protein (TIGR02452 family)
MARRGAQLWDASNFAAKLQNAKSTENWHELKKLLAQVAEHNYHCKEFWRVPRTVPVSKEECRRVRLRPGRGAVFSMSTMTTAEACRHFASDRRNIVCALNFANGQTCGGGYKHGASAQEEDLCRQFPTLYTTLYNASKHGLYPFGPCTAKSPSQPEKYSDVLFTGGLTLGRGGQEDGYPLLAEREQVDVSMVAAAAPNIRFASEISDPSLLYETIETIFKAPFVWQADTNVLILGAWGCGAFGGDPRQIAELFVRALISDCFGQLYKEIHFAIPKLSTTDSNYDEFRRVFQEFSLPLVDVVPRG